MRQKIPKSKTKNSFEQQQNFLQQRPHSKIELVRKRDILSGQTLTKWDVFLHQPRKAHHVYINLMCSHKSHHPFLCLHSKDTLLQLRSFGSCRLNLVFTLLIIILRQYGFKSKFDTFTYITQKKNLSAKKHSSNKPYDEVLVNIKKLIAGMKY